MMRTMRIGIAVWELRRRSPGWGKTRRVLAKMRQMRTVLRCCEVGITGRE